MHRPVAHTYKKPSVVSRRADVVRLCGICLGEIKEGLPFALCDCGKLYHVTCGFRVGVCVSCSAQIEDRMRVDPPAPAPSHPRMPRDGAPPAVPNGDRAPAPLPPKDGLTPRDKLELLEERLLTGHISEATYLELKAKYEDALRRTAPPPEKDAALEFECPECGAALDADASACSRCGVRFIEEMRFTCPECGAVLESSARKCSCGVVFVDSEQEVSCPLCGAVQSMEARRCAGCGAEFSEDLEEIEYRCPACDRVIPEGAERCTCGAIFDRRMEEGTIFECPSCGTMVSESDAFCPRCGAEFE
ncbi:MAG: zinc-ribbon domain-containing protein [Candidatus Thermoplasmatota archaeon]